MTALLRVEDEKADTYQLTMKRNQLIRNVDKGQLPYWVLEAFIKPPQNLNMEPFKSRKVIDVYAFLCQAEVFASSPLVE